MPYHGKDIRSSPIFRSHKTGRYVVNPSGMLGTVEGDRVDLHAFLTEHSPSVEVMPIETKLMRASGLHPGGFALVNKAVKPSDGRIVVVRYNSQVVIRRLTKRNGDWLLIADDPREQDLAVNDDVTIENLGVVIAAIVKF